MLGAAASVTAQAPPDSIDAWIERLQTGSLAERMRATDRLAALDPGTLPPAAAEALIAELRRIHRHWLDGTPIRGEEEFGGEGVAEHHANLVHAVRALESPEGDRALVPAVGTSAAVADRVAGLGDAAVPELVRMIERSFDRAGALRTLGRMWSMADADEIRLSSDSRRIIVTRIFAALASDSAAARFGVAGALGATRDPAFLPLASRLEARADSAGDVVLGSARRARRTLEADAAARSPAYLTRGSYRLLGLLCADVLSGARRGACQAILNELAAAVRHLVAGRSGPARNVLMAVIRRADRALDEGALTVDEHAIVVGGARTVLDRLERSRRGIGRSFDRHGWTPQSGPPRHARRVEHLGDPAPVRGGGPCARVLRGRLDLRLRTLPRRLACRPSVRTTSNS